MMANQKSADAGSEAEEENAYHCAALKKFAHDCQYFKHFPDAFPLLGIGQANQRQAQGRQHCLCSFPVRERHWYPGKVPQQLHL